MTPTVRYDKRHDWWFFGGEKRRDDRAGNIVIARSDLPVATATDLARAIRQAEKYNMEPDAVRIEIDSKDGEYWPESGFTEPISFVVLSDGRLAIHCILEVDVPGLAFAGAVKLCSPLLKRLGAELVDETPLFWARNAELDNVVVAAPTRGKTLEALYEIGRSVKRLIEAAGRGGLNRKTTADLIAGGRADLLIGQPEGPWLDVKTAHYDLTTSRGKISLAQAVSRFANAEEGGIVVVGMGTKKIPGGELIDSIKPVPLDTAIPRRYRQAIETCLFPFPVGLDIRTVEISAGEGLVLVSLPPQEEELKPFLVHGSIVGDRVEGAYISIVRRSGEDSIPITAAQIHSTLAAGRALLRRGQIPHVE
ncbi:hypothetical protein [Actinoplanes sp. G11-F43]|uniref:hypothetical protein n=1 Tax=Actinoplanes sp. G11-F43 TaxID=3424130 RepID=UPI003D343D1C